MRRERELRPTRRDVLQRAGWVAAAAAFPSVTKAAAAPLGQASTPVQTAADFPTSDVMTRLSTYMSQAGDRALPDEVVERAKRHVLDTFAAMVSGSELVPGRAALAFARAYGGKAVATVVGDTIVCGPIEAALVNGTMAHADETDDTLAPGPWHPGCNVVPAALALGEQFGISGTHFLRAVVLGYDIGTRVMAAIQPGMANSHKLSYGIGGVFGAAAAAGCAAGLDAHRCARCNITSVTEARQTDREVIEMTRHNETNARRDRESQMTRRDVLQRAGWVAAAAAFPSVMKAAAPLGQASTPAQTAADFPTSDVMTRLSAYMSQARDRALPDEVVERAKRHVLDTFAAMVSGSELVPGRAALAFARAYGGKAVATVVGDTIVCGPIEAALVNGTMAHADETDDTLAPGPWHPGCNVVPAALALGEQFGISGTHFLRAVVLGYDIGTRVMAAIQPGMANSQIGRAHV